MIQKIGGIRLVKIISGKRVENDRNIPPERRNVRNMRTQSKRLQQSKISLDARFTAIFV